MVQGLCTLPRVPLLSAHSPHCLAVTCAQNDVMGAVCLWQLHLTCFIFVQATVTRKAVRANTSSPCPKGWWQLPTTDSAFPQAIFRKHVRANDSFTHGSIWPLLKSQHGSEILGVCGVVWLPGQRIPLPNEWRNYFCPFWFEMIECGLMTHIVCIALVCIPNRVVYRGS